MSRSETGKQIESAFPESVREDVSRVALILPEPLHLCAATFRVIVKAEMVAIPYRIYHDPQLIRTDQLSSLQQEILSCLLTRHCSGFVRQEHLIRIVGSHQSWAPPFVVQLIGEYVVEICRVVQENQADLDVKLYRDFLEANPALWAVTKQRVVSYWDCYYRATPREKYVGFQIVRYLDSLIQ
ncbi:MAG: hypothetical protein ABSB15_01940 [Bryobacteraceae bacterium]